MNAKSAIAKGKILEEWVALQIREKGIDPKAYRSHGSGNGNTEKGDIWTSMMILGQNAGIECKNQSTLCIPEWWRQTKKLEILHREPVLAFKSFGESLEETKVVIYLDTFLELVKAANGAPRIPERAPLITGVNRDAKYALENLKNAVAKAIKVLPQLSTGQDNG